MYVTYAVCVFTLIDDLGPRQVSKQILGAADVLVETRELGLRLGPTGGREKERVAVRGGSAIGCRGTHMGRGQVRGPHDAPHLSTPLISWTSRPTALPSLSSPRPLLFGGAAPGASLRRGNMKHPPFSPRALRDRPPAAV